jgi:hypothetical protein
VLAGMTGIPEAELAALFEETLLTCADAFAPLSDTDRSRVRGLLYELLETAPAAPDAAFLETLADDQYVPNAEAAVELALTLGAILGNRLELYVGAVLRRVAAQVLEALADLVEAAEAQVEAWIEELEELAVDLARRLTVVLKDITRLGRELDDALDASLQAAEAVLGMFDRTPRGRARTREALRTEVVRHAVGFLNAVPGYLQLPLEARAEVQAQLGRTVDGLLGSLLDPVLDAFGGLAPQASDLLADIRSLEPGADLAEAITTMVLDRLESAARSAYGGRDPEIRLAFTARVDYQPPPVPSLLPGAPPVVPPKIEFTLPVDLGRISLPLGDLLRGLRESAAGLSGFEDAVQTLAADVEALLRAAARLEAAEEEQRRLRTETRAVDLELSQTSPASLDALILAPQPGAIHEGPVEVVLDLPGVPQSYLGLAEREQERVFVWLNKAPLDLSRFSVGPATGDGPVGPSPRPRPGARPVVTDLGVRAPVGAAGRQRGPGQPAVPGPQLTVRLPLAELHGGEVNTLSLAVVDGRGRHRVERTVSFVVVSTAATAGVGRRPVAASGQLQRAHPGTALRAVAGLREAVNNGRLRPQPPGGGG